ncbi:MAG: hypothetical protein QM765_51030 [Myxococcales bacterium]
MGCPRHPELVEGQRIRPAIGQSPTALGVLYSPQVMNLELDWPRQKDFFAPDGSLRDIYVLGTNAEDWATVLSWLGSRCRAECTQNGSPIPLPSRFDQVSRESLLLTVWVGETDLCCHFFVVDEIEFDFVPNQVDEARLRQLLTFMGELGELTGRTVIMTPENWREAPLFKFTPGTSRVAWVGEE